MNDLEQRLRADLALAADSFEAEIDPAQVLRAGKGARRADTVRRLVVAAALVAGIFGVSAVAAPPLIAAIIDSQTVEVSGSFEWDESHSEFDEMSVQLKREGGVVTLVATGQLAGKEVAAVTKELPKTISQPVRVALGSRAVIAVLPGRVEKSEVVVGVGVGGGSGTSWEWMPAFDATVVAVQLEKRVEQPLALDWLWVDELGDVHSVDGTPGAKTTLAGREYVVYRSERADVAGVMGNFGFRLSDLTEESLLDGAMVRGGPDHAVAWQLGVLPVGARDVQLKLSKPTGDWVAVALSDGSVVVLATVPEHVDQVVTSVSYLRADGTKVKIGH